MSQPLCRFGPLGWCCACDNVKAPKDLQPFGGEGEPGEFGEEVVGGRGDGVDQDFPDMLRLASDGRQKQQQAQSAAARRRAKDKGFDGVPLSEHSVETETTATSSAAAAAAAAADDDGGPPPLGPTGSGGWHVEADMTAEMRQVAAAAEEMFLKKERVRLSDFGRRFLTSVTLSSHVDPATPEGLCNTLITRSRNEARLAGRERTELCGSLRITGWDGEGCTVVALETSALKRSLACNLPLVDYVIWSALDCNKPGASRFVLVQDMGGGFNPLHFMNPKALYELAMMLEGQWQRRLKAAFVVSVPAAFRSIINTFLGFLSKETKDRVHLIPDEAAALRELTKLGCDEETLTGMRRTFEARRRKGERCTWHPLADTAFFRERMADLKLSEDTQYLSQEMHERLRGAIQAFRVQRWGASLPPRLPLGRGADAQARRLLGKRPSAADLAAAGLGEEANAVGGSEAHEDKPAVRPSSRRRSRGPGGAGSGLGASPSTASLGKAQGGVCSGGCLAGVASAVRAVKSRFASCCCSA